MSDNNIELSRRRILAGLGTIGIASAATGAGTMALFEDSENATADVQAGTLDLRVNGKDGNVVVLDENGIAPGESGSTSFNLKNAGSVTGILDAMVTTVEDHENGRNDAEKEVDDSSDEGELSKHLKVKFSCGGDTYGPGTLANVKGKMLQLGSLEGNSEKEVTVDWHLPVETGNEVQSDRVKANMRLTLTQETDHPQGTTGTGFPQTSYNKAFGSVLHINKGNWDIGLKQGNNPDAQASFSSGYSTTFQSGEAYDFTLDVSPDGEATLSANDYEVTYDYDGDFSRLALIAAANKDGAAVTVENLSIDGMTALPSSIETDNGKQYVEFTDLSEAFDDGLTLNGTVTFEYSGDGNNQPAGLYIDVAE